MDKQFLEHIERTKKYESKNAMEAFKSKTPFEELPLLMMHGSGSRNPEDRRKGGIVTCDFKLWIKFCDQWFKPYGNFGKGQIQEMIEICINDNQIDALMSMLSSKPI